MGRSSQCFMGRTGDASSLVPNAFVLHNEISQQHRRILFAQLGWLHNVPGDRPTNKLARTSATVSAPRPFSPCVSARARADGDRSRANATLHRHSARSTRVLVPGCRVRGNWHPQSFSVCLTWKELHLCFARSISFRRARLDGDAAISLQGRLHRGGQQFQLRIPAGCGANVVLPKSDSASAQRMQPCTGPPATNRQYAECCQRAGARAVGTAHGRGLPVADPSLDRSGREECRFDPADSRRRRLAASRIRGRTSGLRRA